MSQTFKYAQKSSAQRKIKNLAENQSHTLEKEECGTWVVTITPTAPTPTAPTAQTLFDKVAEKLPKNCQLIYVDYSENLDNTDELKGAITLDKKESEAAADALFEKICDWYLDDKYAENMELSRACDAAGVCFDALDDDDADALRDLLRDCDNSDPVAELVKNTSAQKVRVHLTNIWEGFHPGSHSEYLQVLLAFLRINPREYAEKMGFDCLTEWPAIEYASAPLIDVGSFIDEVENLLSSLAEWVFYGVIDVSDILHIAKEGTYVHLPIGTACGLFDSAWGSGSMLDCTTDEDVKISDKEKFLLTHDDFCGYGIDEVYGLTWEQWKSPVIVAFTA